MTAKEFINTYCKNINRKEFLLVCSKVGINCGTEYSDDLYLTDDQVRRLLYNSRINTHIVNESITSEHDILLGKYAKMIDNYDQLLNGDTQLLPEDRIELEEIRDRLLDERSDYRRFVGELKLRNESKNNNAIYRDYGGHGSLVTNEFDKLRIEGKQNRLERKDEQLEKQYKQADELQSQMQFARSKLKKGILGARYKRKMDKIYKLQSKKGVIESKQRKIINKNAKKYQKKIERNLLINAREQEQQTSIMIEKAAVKQNYDDYSFDYGESKKELESLKQSDKLGDKFRTVGKRIEVSRLKSRSNKASNRLEQLTRKQGRVELRTQFSRTIKSSLKY